MHTRWHCLANLLSRESGFAAASSAIILVSSVATGGVIAGAVIDLNQQASDEVRQTVTNALIDVTTTLEPRGGVVFTDVNRDGLPTAGTDTISFDVGTGVGAGGVVIEGETAQLIVSYRDSGERVASTAYGVTWLRGEGPVLERGELAEVTFVLPPGATLTTNGSFTVEVALPNGAAFTLARDLPPQLSTVTYLP